MVDMDRVPSIFMDRAASSLEELPSTSSAVVLERPRKNVVTLKTRSGGPLAPEQIIYLCGTSHISRKSADDVRELIQAVKPQVVMLELCAERRNILFPVKREEGDTSLVRQLRKWQSGQSSLMTVLYAWMLTSIADQCNLDPGEEFRVALQEALNIGAQVMLGDRLVSITIKRTWGALTRWQKLKMTVNMLFLGITGGKDEAKLLDEIVEDEDVLTNMMKELGKEYPGLLRPLLEERDEYMVYSLRMLASQASKIVAVVGAGHLKGIQEKWDSDINLEAITEVPAEAKSRGWTHIVLVSCASATVLASVVYAVRWRRLS